MDKNGMDKNGIGQNRKWAGPEEYAASPEAEEEVTDLSECGEDIKAAILRNAAALERKEAERCAR